MNCEQVRECLVDKLEMVPFGLPTGVIYTPATETEMIGYVPWLHLLWPQMDAEAEAGALLQFIADQIDWEAHEVEALCAAEVSASCFFFSLAAYWISRVDEWYSKRDEMRPSDVEVHALKVRSFLRRRVDPSECRGTPLERVAFDRAKKWLKGAYFHFRDLRWLAEDMIGMHLTPPEADGPSDLAQPVVWIDGVDTIATRLRPNNVYILNVMMSSPQLPSGGPGQVGLAAAGRMADSGLHTEWAAVSSGVELAAVDDKIVTQRWMSETGDVWGACFELSVPNAGESAVRRISIRPLSTAGGRLSFMVYSKFSLHGHFERRELIRRFEVGLPVQEDQDC